MRHPLWKEGHTQTEVRRWNRIFHANKNKQKKMWGGNTYIVQNSLYNQVCSKGQRRTYHNDEGINPTRDNDPRNHLHTQCSNTIEQLLMGIKKDRDSDTVIVLVHLGPQVPASCIANLHYPQTGFHPCLNVPIYTLAIIMSFKTFH